MAHFCLTFYCLASNDLLLSRVKMQILHQESTCIQVCLDYSKNPLFTWVQIVSCLMCLLETKLAVCSPQVPSESLLWLYACYYSSSQICVNQVFGVGWFNSFLWTIGSKGVEIWQFIPLICYHKYRLPFFSVMNKCTVLNNLIILPVCLT